MSKVKTAVGEIECPPLEMVGPRTRFWCEAIRDVCRTEEMYQVMGAALEEAYKAGAVQAMANFINGFGKLGEVIDVEGKLVEEDNQGGEAADEGSEPDESAGAPEGVGPIESTALAAELPGGLPEGAFGERED